MKTPYTDRIAALKPHHDPRHIEAFMRIEHGTLDHLSPARFKADVEIACECIVTGGFDFAERAAKSYGL